MEGGSVCWSLLSRGAVGKVVAKEQSGELYQDLRIFDTDANEIVTVKGEGRRDMAITRTGTK